MQNDVSPSQLRDTLGISMSYASMLLSGDRTPSQTLAARIFTQFGLKLGPMANLSDEEAATMSRLQAKAA